MVPVQILDLNFLGLQGAIAVYLIPHKAGAILVDCGPGSTVSTLVNAIQANGYQLKDITDIFLTHIHLDHAGAAGWFSRQGVQIHVHPVGAPHMINPDKLLGSARRIYGESMEALWGTFLSVPEEKITVDQDGAEVEIGGVPVKVIDTPGHAYHHNAYIIDNVCYSGDVGGVRIQGSSLIRIPTPPPEFHLEKWRDSLLKLHQMKFEFIAPTHFGLFPDPDIHLSYLLRIIDELDVWIDTYLPQELPLEKLNSLWLDWIEKQANSQGIKPELIAIYEAAIPSWMSLQGIMLYWRKFRQTLVAGSSK
jgi:glyoxylase-like metal-dependent hydrolase (beta-lactamase superfamily II)